MKYSGQQKMGTHGFTLVEMLVYIAILMFIAVGSISMIFGLDDLLAKYRAEQLVYRSASVALERIVYDIREASSLDSYIYTGEGSLTLTVDGNTVTYSTSSTALHRYENGVDTGALTQDSVSVTALRFYGYASTTDLARVEMTLEATVGESTVVRTFNAGAVLRGTYE